VKEIRHSGVVADGHAFTVKRALRLYDEKNAGCWFPARVDQGKRVIRYYDTSPARPGHALS